MPQAKTVVPYLLDVIGIVLILLWIAFIGLLLVQGRLQFTVILVVISLIAIYIVSQNDI